MKYLTFKKLGTYGRIGNQLWEVASLIGLAHKYKAMPCIPTDWKLRPYLNIPEEYYRDVFPSIQVKENEYNYIPNFLESVKSQEVVDIIGTFQSWKYFEDIVPDIKNWLRPKLTDDLGPKTAGLHVRLTDYKGHPNYVQYDTNYYKSVINKYFKGYEIIACSDDTDYLEENFKDCTIIKTGVPISDLTILASCRHHILSASSFSWWGSFLSRYEGINIRPPRTHTGMLAHLDESTMWWPSFKINYTMNIFLCSYADDKFLDKQNRLVQQAEKIEQFDKIISYNRKDLEKTGFYKENKVLLDEPTGGGWWRWKPYYILETLKQMGEGDVLMYLDSGDFVFDGIRPFLEKEMKDNPILLTEASNFQVEYTKMDCMVGMGCMSDKYIEAKQVEAGCIVIKKSDFSIKVIKEWLSYCMTSLVDNTPSSAPNDPGFKEHRNDQSILTNLGIKYGIKTSEDIRRYVECNYETYGLDQGRVDISDVTFIIPIRYDSKERKENIDLTMAFLNKYFITNFIVGEQGSDGMFEYTASENTVYVDFDKYPDFYNPLFMGAFHRTRMLNFMTMMAKTEIIFNWDCDVIIDPRQLLLTVHKLRSGISFCYPYWGDFLHVRRGYFGKVRDTLDVSWMKNIEFPGLNVNSVGGAVGFRKADYFKIGLENENFVSHAPEDVDRMHRFRTVGGEFHRTPGPLYHMEHPMLENSHHGNEWVIFNNSEWRRTKNLKKEGWTQYIKGWKWIEEYKRRFNYNPE